MAEALQGNNKPKQPLWSIAAKMADSPERRASLDDFAKGFAIERGISTGVAESATAIDALAQLLQLASLQFKTGNKNKDDINKNYARATQMHLCHDFIQNRGAVGATLVINQDYIILLTNLAIGDHEKLRFYELIKAFESRGIFFDNQSQQALISFFERIGNVERMSDSGDAVYVRKTL
jgi:DNA phosphorothioation-dependent restriction protein DptG